MAVTSESSAHPRDVQWSLVGIVVVLGLVGLTMTWLTAPLEHLLGESAYRVESALHGVMAGVLMVAVVIGLFQGVRLLAGQVPSLLELQLGSTVTAMLSLVTILYGNRIYIPYRAAGGAEDLFPRTRSGGSQDLLRVQRVHRLVYPATGRLHGVPVLALR